ncbi:hypothetical protein ACKVWC_011606 [Pyricularia oryzae]
MGVAKRLRLASDVMMLVSLRMMVRALATGLCSGCRILGTRFSNIQLLPSEARMASRAFARSSPRCAANPMASLADRIWFAARTWWHIFMLEPAPTPPATMYSLAGSDMACRMSRPLAMASSDAPAMMDSVPSAARMAPPDTGQSTNRMSPRPMSLSCWSSACAYWQGTVLHSISTAPCGRAGTAASGPSISTACACCAVATMHTQKGLSATAWAGVLAALPPAALKRSSVGPQTSKPVTE